MSRKKIEIAPIDIESDTGASGELATLKQEIAEAEARLAKIESDKYKASQSLASIDVEIENAIATRNLLNERNEQLKQSHSELKDAYDLLKRKYDCHDIIASSTASFHALISSLDNTVAELKKGIDITMSEDSKERFRNEGKAFGDSIVRRINSGANDLAESMAHHSCGHYISDNVFWASVAIIIFHFVFLTGIAYINTYTICSDQLWLLIALVGLVTGFSIFWVAYTHVRDWMDRRKEKNRRRC